VLKNRLDGMAYQESPLNHRLGSCRNPLLGSDSRDQAAPHVLCRNPRAFQSEQQSYRRSSSSSHLPPRSADRSQHIWLRIYASKTRSRLGFDPKDKKRLAGGYSPLHISDIWYGYVVPPFPLPSFSDLRLVTGNSSTVMTMCNRLGEFASKLCAPLLLPWLSSVLWIMLGLLHR